MWFGTSASPTSIGSSLYSSATCGPGSRAANEIARIAEGRLTAGDVAELDVSAIRLDAMVGVGEAARAARDAEMAHERLRYVLGMQVSDTVLKPTCMATPELKPLDIDRLVQATTESRPDLRAIQFAIRAAQDRRGICRTQCMATFRLVSRHQRTRKEGL